MEEAWAMQNPYFCIWTTIVGMIVTDMWYLHRSVKHTHRIKSVLEFADKLCFSLLQKAGVMEDETARKHIAKLSKEENQLQVRTNVVKQSTRNPYFLQRASGDPVKVQSQQ